MSASRATARQVRRFLTDKNGATLIEYAMVIGLVSIVIGFLAPEITALVEELILETAAKLNDGGPVLIVK